jgi:hypothetical protein
MLARLRTFAQLPPALPGSVERPLRDAYALSGVRFTVFMLDEAHPVPHGFGNRIKVMCKLSVQDDHLELVEIGYDDLPVSPVSVLAKLAAACFGPLSIAMAIVAVSRGEAEFAFASLGIVAVFVAVWLGLVALVIRGVYALAWVGQRAALEQAGWTSRGEGRWTIEHHEVETP